MAKSVVETDVTYDLVIGDRAYSSWSLRGWLLFDAFGIPVRTLAARLYTDELPALLKQFPPGKTAPTMRTPDGVVAPETIAIAEELASRHPEAAMVLCLEGHGAGFLPDIDRTRLNARQVTREGQLERPSTANSAMAR